MAGRYTYVNQGSQFISDLSVDSSGLVISYPDVWEKVYPVADSSVPQSIEHSPSDFASRLVSSNRSPDIDDASDIYARLLGNWKLTMIDYNSGKKGKNIYAGNWYFSRILEGRAVQDVLICPELSERSSNMSKNGNRYGSSFRMYNPKTRQWHVDWFNPVSGIHNELVARTEGDKIMQESVEKNGLIMRWVFENIKSDSFRWYGITSLDKGKTWTLDAEFFATRIY